MSSNNSLTKADFIILYYDCLPAPAVGVYSVPWWKNIERQAKPLIRKNDLIIVKTSIQLKKLPKSCDWNFAQKYIQLKN